MFLHFFKKEFGRGMSSPMVYIFALVFGALAFGAVASSNVIIGGAIGQVHKNAPVVITDFVTILGLFALLFATAFCNNAALRDYKYQFDEITFSTPIHKSGLFFGRFLGAFLLSCIPFLGLFLGAWLGAIIGPLAGWINADRIGPMGFNLIWSEFIVFVFPNMFLGCAIIYWLSHRFKSTIISFIGAFAIIMLYILSGTIMSNMDSRTTAALMDAFGINAYHEVIRYYSVADKNTIVPTLTGILLKNRLIWIGVGILVTVFSYLTFKLKIRTGKAKKKKLEQQQDTAYIQIPQIIKAKQSFNLQTTFQQFKSIFSIDLSSMIKSPVFILLLFFAAVMVIINLVQGFSAFGLKTYPITYHMVSVIENNTIIFTAIIIVFFSGELMAKSRENHFDQVINATPHASITPILAHIAALVGLSVLFHFFFIIIAIVAQLAQGFTHIELGVYFGNFFLYALPGYLFNAVLFIFFQTLFKNRYVGYFISILFLFVWAILLQILHVSTNMLDYGSVPQMGYSDLNGFGSGVKAAVWFNIYWTLFASLLIVLAGVLYPRRVVSGKEDKWKQVKGNLTKNVLRFGVGALALFLICAGWVYYNTKVLNTYKSSKEYELLQVKYEKQYKKYQNFPLPKIAAISYDIQIYPHKRAFHALSKLTLLNPHSEPLDSLLFFTDADWDMKLNIPNAQKVFQDKELGFEIYKLNQPLATQDSITITVQSSYDAKGFENSVSNTSVNQNGTFVNNSDILPQIGYNPDLELSDINKRKKYKLPQKDRVPPLDSNNVTAKMKNYLTNGLSDWIPVTTKISTSGDQIAIAPGRLLKEWKEGDRNHYEYRVEQPSQNFYSFQSARYQVKKKEWNGISLEVYYSPKHPYNVDIMMHALQKSLDYYIHHFGPYYHKEARIIEFPNYASFAQSFPGTMPYSESIGFILDLRDTNKNNLVEAVVAHEIAHQWWAHQEIPALMQGMTMLTESFAEYSSLMVLHQTRDDIKMREFLKYDYDRYLSGRGLESEKEVPLYKVENQQYIHYGKGSTILYALANYIGENQMNTALSNFLNRFKYKNPPYPISYDFIQDLRAQTPDSLQYLITDWIEKITLYDLRMETATSKKKANGKFDVTMTIEAKKMYSDSLGNETPASIDDWIDLGLFSDKGLKKLTWIKRVKINQPKMTFSFEVDEQPTMAMIDPKRFYMERDVADNSVSVTK